MGNGERSITISVREYVQLLELKVRTEIFEDYVKRSRYSIDREACARHLGFELEEEEER